MDNTTIPYAAISLVFYGLWSILPPPSMARNARYPHVHPEQGGTGLASGWPSSQEPVTTSGWIGCGEADHESSRIYAWLGIPSYPFPVAAASAVFSQNIVSTRNSLKSGPTNFLNGFVPSQPPYREQGPQHCWRSGRVGYHQHPMLVFNFSPWAGVAGSRQ